MEIDVHDTDADRVSTAELFLTGKGEAHPC